MNGTHRAKGYSKEEEKYTDEEEIEEEKEDDEEEYKVGQQEEDQEQGGEQEGEGKEDEEGGAGKQQQPNLRSRGRWRIKKPRFALIYRGGAAGVTVGCCKCRALRVVFEDYASCSSPSLAHR